MTLIQYFEGNGSRHFGAEENPAEFILDVIGAGATSTSKEDWHQIWINSPESTLVDNEIDAIVSQRRNTLAVTAAIGSGFATPWIYQVWVLLVRNLTHYWRSPTYLMAKLMLNIVGGLSIGFTFFQRSKSITIYLSFNLVQIRRNVHDSQARKFIDERSSSAREARV